MEPTKPYTKYSDVDLKGPIKMQFACGDRVTLQKFCIGEEMLVSRSMYLHHPSIETLERGVMTDILYRMRAYVLGYDQEPIHIFFDKSAWQTFKRRWFPKWLLKWFPVQTEKLEITPRILYPFLEAPLTDSPFVIILKRK